VKLLSVINDLKLIVSWTNQELSDRYSQL